MRLVILSGRSGSGKSTALRLLEDAGFYCIDNLPGGMLPALVEHCLAEASPEYQRMAVCIDARNSVEDLKDFPRVLDNLPEATRHTLVYLDARDSNLLHRFSETRRRHPLSNQERALKEAIQAEKNLLDPVMHRADLVIDTSHLNVHELRDLLRRRLLGSTGQGLSLLFQSFAYRRGVPIDADLVFDARCLPNPYWDPALRQYSGLDEPVMRFMEQDPLIQAMRDDITHYLDTWLPHYQHGDRSYLMVAIGCTGGQHRSVYLCEQLQAHFQPRYSDVQVRHRELAPPPLD